MLADLRNMSNTLSSMESLQANLNIGNANELQDGNKIFSILEALKSNRNEINLASIAYALILMGYRATLIY
jgi:hypothetical protein